MQPIIFSYKIDYKSYIRVSFNRLYATSSVWFIYIVCFFVAATNIFGPNSPNDSPIVSLFLAILVILILHLAFYYRVKNRYKTTPMVGEETFF